MSVTYCFILAVIIQMSAGRGWRGLCIYSFNATLSMIEQRDSAAVCLIIREESVLVLLEWPVGPSGLGYVLQL